MKTDAAKGRESDENEKKNRCGGATSCARSASAPAPLWPPSAPLVEQAAADSETNDEKRKARYQANSADVQNYYRVNRYPK